MHPDDDANQARVFRSTRWKTIAAVGWMLSASLLFFFIARDKPFSEAASDFISTLSIELAAGLFVFIALVFALKGERDDEQRRVVESALESYFSRSNDSVIELGKIESEVLPRSVERELDGPKPSADERPITLTRIPTSEIAPESIEEARRDIIKAFLRSTWRLFCAVTKTEKVRLYCHIANHQTAQLRPIAIVNLDKDRDYRVEIPFKSDEDAKTYVLASAMKSKDVAAWNLDDDHYLKYSPSLRGKIRKDLKCVIAVPIYAYTPYDYSRLPVGTLSIDSYGASLEQLGVVDENGAITADVDNMLKSCARVVYHILTLAAVPSTKASR